MIEIRKVDIPTLPASKPRRLYISLPRGYENEERRYPVIYMFDGHNVFYDSHATYGKSWGMREYLKKSKLPVIIAAIECSHDGENRLSEYSPWDFSARGLGAVEGRGRLTMEWITESLKPMIDSEFRTLPSREHTMIAGSSMGGLMSVYAAIEYGNVFSRAAALSPTLFLAQRPLNALIAERGIEKPLRVYLDYGSGETDEHPAPWVQMFQLAKKLSDAGAYVSAQVVPGALHSEAYWEKRIPTFMDFLRFEDEI